MGMGGVGWGSLMKTVKDKISLLTVSRHTGLGREDLGGVVGETTSLKVESKGC